MMLTWCWKGALLTNSHHLLQQYKDILAGKMLEKRTQLRALVMKKMIAMAFAVKIKRKEQRRGEEQRGAQKSREQARNTMCSRPRPKSLTLPEGKTYVSLCFWVYFRFRYYESVGENYGFLICWISFFVNKMRKEQRTWYNNREEERGEDDKRETREEKIGRGRNREDTEEERGSESRID